MSDTPRTDVEERWAEWNGNDFKVVHVEFAQQLERELAEQKGALSDVTTRVREIHAIVGEGFDEDSDPAAAWEACQKAMGVALAILTDTKTPSAYPEVHRLAEAEAYAGLQKQALEDIGALCAESGHGPADERIRKIAARLDACHEIVRPQGRHDRGCFNDSPGASLCQVCGGDLPDTRTAVVPGFAEGLQRAASIVQEFNEQSEVGDLLDMIIAAIVAELPNPVLSQGQSEGPEA